MTDTSSVVHKSMLAAFHATLVPDATPWVFVCDKGGIAYVTEEAACDAQRKWREAERARAALASAKGQER